MSENLLEESDFDVPVALVGVGGSGCEHVARLDCLGLNLRKIYIDTNARDLRNCKDGEQFRFGNGLGTGRKAELAEAAANEKEDEIAKLLGNAKMVIIVAAFGHGTGSGAAPIVARIAREREMLVASFVTMPFTSEGNVPSEVASRAFLQILPESHFWVKLDCNYLTTEDLQGDVLQKYEVPFRWIQIGVQTLLKLVLSDDKNVRMDFIAFRNFFPVPGEKICFGVGEAAGTDALHNALRNIAECPLIPKRGKCENLIVLVHAGTLPSSETMDEITRGIAEKLGGNKQIEVRYEIVPEAGDSVKITILGAGEISAAKKLREKTLTPRDGQKLRDNTIDLPLDYTGQPGLGIDDRGIFSDLDSLKFMLSDGREIDLEVPTYFRADKALQQKLKKLQGKGK